MPQHLSRSWFETRAFERRQCFNSWFWAVQSVNLCSHDVWEHTINRSYIKTLRNNNELVLTRVSLWPVRPPPPPSSCTEMCAHSQGFCTTENARAFKLQCPQGRVFVSVLSYTKIVNSHSHSGLKIKLFECRRGPGKVEKTQNAISNCSFAVSLWISPVTNGLLTDLGLTIPPKFFFENFTVKCVSTSVYSPI